MARFVSRVFSLTHQISQRTSTITSINARTFATRTAPGITPVHVSLNNIADLDGARQQKTRLGRGIGSGKGKTAGRGHKGSKSRNSRGLKPWFIGGQTPLYKRIPKRGFKSRRPDMDIVNLQRIHELVQQQRIDPSQTITMKMLIAANAVSKSCKHGVKLLAGGFHNYKHDEAKYKLPKLTIEVSDCSIPAKEAIEAAGGKVEIIYHNRVTLQHHLKPHKFIAAPQFQPIPPPRLRRKYAEQLIGQRSKARMGDRL